MTHAQPLAQVARQPNSQSSNLRQLPSQTAASVCDVPAPLGLRHHDRAEALVCPSLACAARHWLFIRGTPEVVAYCHPIRGGLRRAIGVIYCSGGTDT